MDSTINRDPRHDTPGSSNSVLSVTDIHASTVTIEKVLDHSESGTGANQDIVYVRVSNVRDEQPSSPLQEIQLADSLTDPESRHSTTFTHLVQSVMLPSRIMMSALRIPFKVALKGKRRPTWTTEMEMAVSAFRSACRNAPRDLNILRSWLDVDIFPSLMLPSTVRMHETSLHAMKLEWIYPSSLQRNTGRHSSRHEIRDWSKEFPVVLYLHGGGFALCGNNTHRAMVAQFAAEGLILCAPNYRRPPDVSIIEAVDDCLATYRYLVDVLGIAPSRLSVMGDSAGGALTVLLLCRLRDMNQLRANEQSIPVPACGVLLSPWVELEDASIASEAEKGNIMPDHDFLPRDALMMISRLVVGDLSPTDPRINPISARLDSLPKLLIHVGELELLFDQVTRFYEKIRDEGGQVKMKIWIDGVHVPHVFTSVCEEARMVVYDAANFITLNTTS